MMAIKGKSYNTQIYICVVLNAVCCLTMTKNSVVCFVYAQFGSENVASLMTDHAGNRNKKTDVSKKQNELVPCFYSYGKCFVAFIKHRDI